ncbi:MAG TPA: YihY/virulence factor BrkB family protein [Pyrinomonadaceae bacterium]|nr:YihY/virulence factor BrkB family protein [Pyrinomonadaceae bacterium]
MAQAKASMWGFGGLSWKDLGKRVWHEMNEDDVWGRAAQLSYYFLLALFPLLLVMMALLGIFADKGTELRNNLISYLAEVMPSSAGDLVKSTVEELSNSAGAGKISFGLLATLWAASNGMGAITETLNTAYEVKESRSYWKVRLVAIGLTVALALLIVTALALLLYGFQIADAIATWAGLSGVFTITWKIVQWPIILFFILLAFNLIYYFAPDLKKQEWKWVTPGAAIGVALWLLVSFCFKLYLSYFNSYSATYGSLGALIIMMLWFYFTGMAIMIGGEVNSEIENAAAEAGAPDAKEKGEKTPDENERKAAKGRKGKK